MKRRPSKPNMAAMSNGEAIVCHQRQAQSFLSGGAIGLK